MSDRSLRKYDVVLWGATGFTGRLVADYLLSTYGVAGSLRWAIAGRSLAKLEAVRTALGDAAKSLDLLVADADDQSSLEILARQSRVICSTVGPYTFYGDPLVAACVQTGTDYCDLAGEALWIQRMVDRHHDAARLSGARIVCSAGFDSIPSDFGVAFLSAHVQATTGKPCSRIGLRVESMVGAFSGGTVAAMLEVQRTMRSDPAGAAVLRDPYSLNPEGQRSGPDGPDLVSAAFDSDLNVWLAPFIMEGINTRIVRRTNALLGYPYGREFRYSEATMMGPGVGGWLAAQAMSAGLAAFVGAATYTPRLLRPLLPSPGEGPSLAAREKGSFSLLFVGETAEGRLIKARVQGNRDPGYGATSRMLGESAVCLAKDISPDVAGGILTPVSAMQKELLPRLMSKAGINFEIVGG